MKLEGKKIAIFVEKMFEDVEFVYPYYRMKEEGAEVVVIAPKADSYRGKHGIIAKPDKVINDADASEFDALIIPGGYSPDHMRRSKQMVEFVKKMDKDKKVVAAVCHGPWMLASAGTLSGKKATSFFSLKDDIVNAGAQWVDQEVVVDGNIITSRKPDDLPAFCRSIIEVMVNKSAGVEVL